MKFSDKSFESFPPNYVAVAQKEELLGIDSESTLMSGDEDKENREVFVEILSPGDEIESKSSDTPTDEQDNETNVAEDNNEGGNFLARGGDCVKMTMPGAHLESFPPHFLIVDEKEALGNNRGRSYSVDQQKPVGSTREGGQVFDSGCNVSGVRKVCVRHGRVPITWFKYQHVIKDIVLEFNENFDDADDDNSNSATMNTDSESVLKIDRDDCINRIDVWTDNKFVTAVRFHLASGCKSKIYGVLPDPSPPPISFRGNRSVSRLVGVHGTRGKGFLQRLGFTFAHQKSSPLGNDIDRSIWDRDYQSTETPNYYFSSDIGPDRDTHAGGKEKEKSYNYAWAVAKSKEYGLVVAQVIVGFLFLSVCVAKRISIK